MRNKRSTESGPLIEGPMGWYVIGVSQAPDDASGDRPPGPAYERIAH